MAQPPAVLIWFRAYCGLMALLYLVCIPGIPMVFMMDAPPSGDERTVMIVFSAMMAALCLLLLVAFLLSFFLQPRPWVWIYDLVLIVIGLTSACFLIICIPLLVFWLKPETKAWFARN